MNTQDKKLWFRRKSYGWGWTPCSWQGWVVLAAYLLVIMLFSYYTSGDMYPDGNLLVRFIFPFGVLTAILIFICYKKGEKPAWQWGEKKDK